MSTPNLDVLTITSQSAGTLIAGPDDPPTLLINLDQSNTVFLHNGTAFASTDASGIFPLAAGMALVVNPSEVDTGLSIYAVTAPGETVNLGIVPGGVHFFQPFSRITIPSGATVGQRIVIDGTTGTITMYDATNAITGQWSSSDQSIYVGKNNNYVKLKETGNLAEILFNADTTLETDGSVGAATPGGGQAGLDLVSPKLIANSGPQASLSLISGDGANQNPVVVSGTKLGTTATSIQSNNFLYASGNQDGSAAGNVPLGAAPSGDVLIASTTINAESGRRYRIEVCFDGISTGGTQTNNHYIFRIKRGASIIMSTRQSATNINQNDCGGSLFVYDTPIAAGNPGGFVTYNFTANHDVGTDVSSLTSPAIIGVSGWI